MWAPFFDAAVVPGASCFALRKSTMASPPRKPVPTGIGSRLEAIEALDRVSNAHLPARRNAPQQSHHAYKSDAAWGQPYGAPQALHHDAPTSPSRMPRVSQPLRVEPPPDFNAPARVQRLKGAGARSSADIMMLSSKLARRPMVGAPTARARPDKIRDYDMRAAACQRAGRQSRAAHLVFNQGVLYENMGEDEVALRCYKDLLRASLDAGDAVGEALACNCIGVTIQLRGGADAMREAIKYHQQHLAVADVPGKFIAHCNLGLAYHALNMIEEATINHQHALRYAIRMSSLAGESLACGHLGLLGSAADAATSKVRD